MIAVGQRRLLMLLAAFGLGYFVFVSFFMVTHYTGPLAKPLARLIVVPAASVKGEHLSYHRLVQLTRGMKAFTEADKHKLAFDQALALGVHQLYIEDLGEELDVRVGKDEVEHYVVNEAALAQDLEAARWDMADYRKYILRPVLLSQAVNQAVSQNRDLQAEAYADMESLRKRLDLDMPFADVAEQFSQDPSALSRGDLGLMTEAEVPEWLRPATALEPGGVSPVLDAPEALWTVLLISNNPSNEDIVYHFRGFAIRKRPLAIIVAERTANQPAWVFVW